MTTAAIRIVREVSISSVPRPGTTLGLRAITYQVGPRPPQVVIVAEDELPDRVWLAENAPRTDVPPDVLAAGDAARRSAILERLGELPSDRSRVI